MLLMSMRAVVSGLVLLGYVLMVGCSTTGSDVRQMSKQTDLSSADGVLVAVTGEQIQVSSQDSGRLYKLHSRPAGVLRAARTVAQHYGFKVVDVARADYIFNVKSAVPDGGACIGGVDAAELNASYTFSLLTLGAFPATAVHCMVVVIELYSVINGEQALMGEFMSNAGAVEVVAGANDLRNYQRTVDANDEMRALEESIGSLYSEVINEDAFR